jgi:hypothetical protein
MSQCAWGADESNQVRMNQYAREANERAGPAGNDDDARHVGHPCEMGDRSQRYVYYALLEDGTKEALDILID